MSSDSDSDVCDFTSDIGKQMSKGRAQFLQHFTRVLENYKPADDALLNNRDDLNVVQATSNLNTKEGFGDSINTNQIYVKDNINKSYSENEHMNAPYRISNKLSQLSEEIDSILENKRRKSQRIKNKRKKVSKPQTKPTENNVYIPNLYLDDSDAFVSDSEINDVISALMEADKEKEKEELNPIVTVNVLWKSVTSNSFKVHKFQPLSCILEHYSETYNVKLELLFFILDDKHINLNENSFVSLRLNSEKQIEGGILPESCLETLQQSVNFINMETDRKFKVRYKEQKCEVGVDYKKDDRMEIVFWQVSRHFKQPVENIKLYFKNYVIKPNIYISDLNLEECSYVDMRVLNSS